MKRHFEEGRKERGACVTPNSTQSSMERGAICLVVGEREVRPVLRLETYYPAYHTETQCWESSMALTLRLIPTD